MDKSMKVTINGVEKELKEGDVIEIPSHIGFTEEKQWLDTLCNTAVWEPILTRPMNPTGIKFRTCIRIQPNKQ